MSEGWCRIATREDWGNERAATDNAEGIGAGLFEVRRPPNLGDIQMGIPNLVLHNPDSASLADAFSCLGHDET